MTHLIKKFALFSALIIMASCSSDDDSPQPINQEEVINVVTLHFTKQSDNTTFDYVWEDGVTPNSLTLDAQETYSVEIEFLNTTVSPTDNVTDEVIEEKDDHFITYSSTQSELQVTRSNTDVTRTDGNKLGIHTIWGTTNTTNGILQLSLIHMPATTSEANGGTVTGGETDISIQINYNIN